MNGYLRILLALGTGVLFVLPVSALMLSAFLFSVQTGVGTDYDLYDSMQACGAFLFIGSSTWLAWIALFFNGKWRFLLGAPFAVFACGGFLFVAIGSWSTHQIMAKQDPIARQLTTEMAARSTHSPGVRGLDLATLNGGAWQAACLLGGYTKPNEIIRNLIGPDRLPSVDNWEEVPEFDAVVIYRTADHEWQRLRYPNAFGPGGQHFGHCITKPETIVPL